MTSAYRSSTATGLLASALAAIATICWARTSSGLRGTTVGSIRPSRMSLATTADSSRSARNFGKMRPLETSPTLWPARPMRCRPRATDFGDSTCRTRSTAPMSMPSSSDEVATRHGQLAGLEQLLDDRALLAGERAVVGAGDLARRRVLGEVGVGQLVEAQRQALGAAAVVDEDDRRAVLADEREELGVDRRPDRLARRLPAGHRIERVERAGRLLRLDHRLDRHLDAQVERLAHARVDDRRLAARADHEAADLLERVLRRAQADALGVAAVVLQRRQPLEREGEVRAALRPGDRVDLVDDDRLDAARASRAPAR